MWLMQASAWRGQYLAYYRWRSLTLSKLKPVLQTSRVLFKMHFWAPLYTVQKHHQWLHTVALRSICFNCKVGDTIREHMKRIRCKTSIGRKLEVARFRIPLTWLADGFNRALPTSVKNNTRLWDTVVKKVLSDMIGYCISQCFKLCMSFSADIVHRFMFEEGDCSLVTLLVSSLRGKKRILRYQITIQTKNYLFVDACKMEFWKVLSVEQ